MLSIISVALSKGRISTLVSMSFVPSIPPLNLASDIVHGTVIISSVGSHDVTNILEAVSLAALIVLSYKSFSNAFSLLSFLGVDHQYMHIALG